MDRQLKTISPHISPILSPMHAHTSQSIQNTLHETCRSIHDEHKNHANEVLQHAMHQIC